MWLSFVFLSGFLLLGAIIGAYLFLMQRSHWQPCPKDLAVPQALRDQLENYAQTQRGKLENCEIYVIENEPEKKHKKRRGNYRFSLRTKSGLSRSYWSRLPSGDFYPESPLAAEIAHHC
jgi:hypothetical protein